MSAVPPFTTSNFTPTVDNTQSAAPISSLSSVESAIADTKNGITPPAAILRFPQETIQFGTLFRFVKYDYQNQKTNTKFISSMNGPSIALPLPVQLQMALGLSYAGVDTGILGFSAKAGAQFADNLMSSNTSIHDAAINGLSGRLASAQEAGRDIGNIAMYALRKAAANKLLGGASGEAAIDQMLGNVINPFNVATFRNVQSRAYTLSFNLIATSQAESDQIKQICDAFMYHSLPYKSEGSAEAQGQTFFLNMPDEVEICYFGTQYLYQFARAAITSVSVDYAPLGQPSFFGASKAPTMVTLNLGIQEIQQLTRQAFDAAVQANTNPLLTPASNTSSDIFNPPNIGS